MPVGLCEKLSELAYKLRKLMSWEWRVFFAVQDAALPGAATDIWKLLHYKPWGGFLLAGHTRTDVYLVCSAGAGVKLRGRTTLEVKLRSCRKDSGVELWEKVCGCMLTTHVRDFCKLFFS